MILLCEIFVIWNMNESNKKNGDFDVNTEEQTVATIIFEVDYGEVCRLCMSKTHKDSEDKSAPTTVFSIHEDSIQFCDLAMALTSVKIDKYDNLPKKLCNECRVQLVQFNAFKRNCEATDRALNAIFKTDIKQPLQVDEDRRTEMCTTLIDDVVGTEAFDHCNEEDMLESNCDDAINIEKAKLNCETKKKKKRQPPKRKGTTLNAKEKMRKVCEECGLTFSSNCTLRRHRITHTGQKDFICFICQNRFARKFHLDMHMRIHLKIRPHIRETCANSFSTSSDLSRHRRIHLDVKNYACVVCERRFKRSSDVIKHMRSHTGQKPYTCGAESCDKKYSSHSGLSKHLRRHHPQLVLQRVTEVIEKKAKEQQIIDQKKYAICHTIVDSAS